MTMQRLKDKVAVVAGAGGIGGATALRLAQEGCRVVLGDKIPQAAESVVGEIAAAGGTAVAAAYDQADETSVAALVHAAVAAFGRLDYLHANAYDAALLARDTDAMSIALDDFDLTLDVNLRGYLLLTRSALPHLLETRGAIVYTSSGAAYAGEPVRLAYAVSKAGINALMRHVASKWGKAGVRANSICPGLVLTESVLARNSEARIDGMLAAHRSWRLGRPEDIAGMVAMLFSADGEWITGQAISVDGGISMRP
jgi:NAD(P)-dependent dehydrogenase (short-subunit alcohol dehydrogenase family)